MKSNIWIKWYKRLIYISVGIILFIGLGFALDAYDFEEFLAIFIPALAVAGLDLVFGMVLATFFENVQFIRDKIEKM